MANNAIEMYVGSSLIERQHYAGTIAQAGMLLPQGLRDGNQGSPGKVMLVMETGAMLGIHPVAAIQGVNIIEGKPTVSPGLMSAVVRRAGHKLRVTTEGTVKDGTIKATAVLIRGDDPEFPFTVTWDLDKARHAGLYPGKDRSAWSKYPEAMLKARAISEVCREGATDALMGVAYVPEELGAEVNEAGEVVLGELQPRQDAARSQEAPQQAAPKATPPVPTLQQENAQLWVGKVHKAKTADEARQVFKDAQLAGALGQMVFIDPERKEQEKLGDYLVATGKALAAQEALAEQAKEAAAAEFSKDDNVEDAVVVTDDSDEDRPMVFADPNTGEVKE